MRIRHSLKVVRAKQTNKKHETVVQIALAKPTNTNFVVFNVKKHWGINESKSKETADRMQEDLCQVEQILEHLNIEISS